MDENILLNLINKGYEVQMVIKKIGTNLYVSYDGEKLVLAESLTATEDSTDEELYETAYSKIEIPAKDDYGESVIQNLKLFLKEVGIIKTKKK